MKTSGSTTVMMKDIERRVKRLSFKLINKITQCTRSSKGSWLLRTVNVSSSIISRTPLEKADDKNWDPEEHSFLIHEQLFRHKSFTVQLLWWVVPRVFRLSLSRWSLLPTVLSDLGEARSLFLSYSLRSSEVFLASIPSGASALLYFTEDM